MTPLRRDRHKDAGPIIEALRAWELEHGRPPTQMEWRRQPAGPGHPSVSFVIRCFGSWGAARVAAGFDRNPHLLPEGTREQIVNLYGDGWTWRAIAVRLDVGMPTIAAALAAAGGPSRRPR